MMSNNKTTSIGLTIAILAAAEPVINTFQSGEIKPLDIVKLLVAIGLAALGYLSQDAKKEEPKP